MNDVSFTVEDGEFAALVGPSGCGKTTTLNLIAGLIPISGGDIPIGGRRVNDLNSKDRDIAMLIQTYALYPNKTVFKNLAFPPQMRKLPKSEIDAKVRVQMRTELERFHQDLHATSIHVTHDQLVAVTTADKMAEMSGGALQQYDTPKNFYEHPVNTFFANFVGCPAMSFVPVSAQTSADGVSLVGAGGWRLKLSPENARMAQSSNTAAGVPGARHSSIKSHRTSRPGLNSIRRAFICSTA